jgi:hypothetical protein
VRDFVLDAVLREVERHEFRARLAKRRPSIWAGRPRRACKRCARRASLVTADGPLARAPGLGIVVHDVRQA